jgi:RNA polymerase II subunit A C-terminal domain phosphatase
VKRLLNEKKLSMLLDLDQTVVHATVDDQVKGWLEDPENLSFPRINDVSWFTLPDSPIAYYIKLRYLVLLIKTWNKTVFARNV